MASSRKCPPPPSPPAGSSARLTRNQARNAPYMASSRNCPPPSSPPGSSARLTRSQARNAPYIEFSNDDVNALLQEHVNENDYIRRLKQCVRWFQYIDARDKKKFKNELGTGDEIRRLEERLSSAEEKVDELQRRLADADVRILEGELLRKNLHDTVMELKGNIRVFCRVRPLLSDDGAGIDTVVSYPTSMESQGRAIDITQNGKKISFTFDKVFCPDASQLDVFAEISQLVQSALDGYKVCLFAYGQTGSGKTYTMMGKPGLADQKGVIPRSLDQVFETRQILQGQGWKYEMQVSVLETCNEKIWDLLATDSSTNLEIRVDSDGNPHVSGLSILSVHSSEEVSFHLERANERRSVGKTQMNEESSSSHLVFTLRILGVNERTDQQIKGVLNMIDLAGSESPWSTGDSQVKETQAINCSLLSLRDVIYALANKAKHVPYRNSKLTRLLEPYLGGDAKTLMFVNISPDPSSVGESLNSLRFATSVNACGSGPRRA